MPASIPIFSRSRSLNYPRDFALARGTAVLPLFVKLLATRDKLVKMASELTTQISAVAEMRAKAIGQRVVLQYEATLGAGRDLAFGSPGSARSSANNGLLNRHIPQLSGLGL